MNIPKYALEHKKVVHLLLTLILVVGVSAYFTLGKKEDAPFVIKTAVLTTTYPGATPEEVEELITEVIEREVQAAPGVDFIKSESYYGFSKIFVNLYQHYKNADMPQLWDELRRKVKYAQDKLPPGASEIGINDDFGDVFGLYFAVTADAGFSYSELRDYANQVKTNLVPIEGVAKVNLFGEQQEVINLEISTEKLSNLGIHPNQITQALQAQNSLVNTGDVHLETIQIKIKAEGDFRNIDDIRNVIIQTANENQFKLGDIALITKGYLDPPRVMMRMNGLPAIGMGISTPLDANVVEVGGLVQKKLDDINELLPIGIEIQGIYFEDKIADEANNNFILNLIISVSIVIFIILLAMGVRAGVLIGSSLIFSILGTMVVMLPIGLALHRTSLAAFIIAMGMLVDNAIVVTDNAMMSIKKGVPKKKALIDAALVPQWGLFGATIIAIGSFLPLYLAPANAAEVIKPLFVVLAISLFLSWIFALIQTTVFGEFLLKSSSGEGADPYDTPFYKKFTTFIVKVIDAKYLTLGIVVVLFFLSMVAFSFVERSFFPAIDKPYFKVDLWEPEGTNIIKTENDVKKIEEYLLAREDVKNVSITIGQSPLRYYLASASFGPKSNFANFLIETYEPNQAIPVLEELENHILTNFPDAMPIMQRFMVSPVPDASIEATFTGPDPKVLRELTEEAKAIMREEPLAVNIRDSWGEKVLVLEPNFSQSKGQLLGVTKEGMASSLKMLSNGIPVGNYREGDKFMPILLFNSERKNLSFNNAGTYPVFSVTGKAVALNQVTEGHTLDWRNGVIRRYNRERALAAQCDPIRGIEIPELEALILPKLEQIELPPGYGLRYEGMKYYQDITQSAIAKNFPLTLILFIFILTILFNDYKKPIIILLAVPLMMIGIVLSLLISGAPYGFFATLGLLGLIGMVIKNAIVLIDQINLEQEQGHDQYNAVINATKSRVIPVSMAAGTTILGMLPLLPDPMFGGMAATIMGGLFAATLLTIIVIPVLYVLFFRVKKTAN
ncbi:efflux RND transporter permease subunit [Marinilabiliaceae bacterium JC017]|nr:efflux RND transporter permease subunit [Marinilabiliaceae bacterium JC017]